MEIKKITTKTFAEHVAGGFRYDISMISDGGELLQVQASIYEIGDTYAGSFSWQKSSGMSLNLQQSENLSAVGQEIAEIMEDCKRVVSADSENDKD